MEIINRKEAKERGLNKYFTGDPCVHGHVSKRLTSDRSCVTCRVTVRMLPENVAKKAKYQKIYEKDNSGMLSAKKKKYRVKRKKELSEQGSKYYQKNKKRLNIYFLENKEILSIKANIRNSSPARYKTYSHQLLGHQCRELSDGSLETKCKECNAWYKPTTIQVSRRVSAIKGTSSSAGSECNLYCSDKCKENCDIFNAKKTPKTLRVATKKSRCNQPSNKAALIDSQIDMHGYSSCEKCGIKTNKLELHHGIMIADNHLESDNMAHQILLCGACHKLPGAHCRE